MAFEVNKLHPLFAAELIGADAARGEDMSAIPAGLQLAMAAEPAKAPAA